MSAASGRIGPATRLARESTTHRMHGARRWSAPRVEHAGRYVEDRLGPGVGSFLVAMARALEPTRPSHRSRNTALMTLGIMGLIGVLGALATRRSTMRSRADAEEMMEEPTTAPTPMESRPGGGRLHTT
ncbi:MAG: hypothetical protein ACRDOO_26540 [Actinomadura sp.]